MSSARPPSCRRGRAVFPTAEMASSAFSRVRATASMASSALACVRGDALDGLVGLGLGARRRPRWRRRPWPGCARRPRSPRRPRRVAVTRRSWRPRGRRSPRPGRQRRRPGRAALHLADAAPTRGTRARASVTPSRSPSTAERTSDGPGSDGSLTRPTLRTATVGHYPVASVVRRPAATAARASGVVTGGAPVSSGRATPTGADDDEKVSTAVGEQPTRDGAGGPGKSPVAAPSAPAGPATASRAPRIR